MNPARYSEMFEFSNMRWKVFLDKASESDCGFQVKTAVVEEMGKGSETVFRNSCGSCCSRFWRRLRSDVLLLLIIIGVIIGFVVGVSVNGPINEIKNLEEKKTALMLIGFPGELFMNMLNMLIMPLIIASVICALAALDAKASGRVGRRALIYYLSTTILAVILGIVLVVTIRPGSSGRPDGPAKKAGPYRTLDAFLDWIRSCFPNNIIAAAFVQKKTKYTSVAPELRYFNKTVNIHNMNASELVGMKIFFNGTHNLTTLSEVVMPGSNTVPAGTMVDPNGGTNVLGILIFSVVFGAMLGRMGERGMPLKAFFETLNEIIMKMVILVMWFSPIGICSLIAAKVASMASIGNSLSMLGLYMLTVIVGLLVHGGIVLPLIFFVTARRNPFRFILGMRDALFTAFGTSSSLATLPTTMRCLENNNKVDARISRFVLPVGATVNMDGTALYEAVAAIFIAQINGITLEIGELVTTCLTATLASIGAAGIPQAGLVTMIIVLQAVNLPTDDVGLILAVDWFLDRIRTTTNVLGDSFGAGIVEHLSRVDLMNMDYTAREEGEMLSGEDKFNPRDTETIMDARDASVRETNF